MFIVQLPKIEQEMIRERLKRAFKYVYGDEASDGEITLFVETAMCDKVQNIVPLIEEVERSMI